MKDQRHAAPAKQMQMKPGDAQGQFWGPRGSARSFSAAQGEQAALRDSLKQYFEPK